MIFLLFLPPGPESGSKWNFMCSWIRISIFRECRYEYLPYADSQHCLQVAVPRIFLKNSLPCLMKEARLFCNIIFSSVFRFSSLIFVFPPPSPSSAAVWVGGTACRRRSGADQGDRREVPLHSALQARRPSSSFEYRVVAQWEFKRLPGFRVWVWIPN